MNFQGILDTLKNTIGGFFKPQVTSFQASPEDRARDQQKTDAAFAAKGLFRGDDGVYRSRPSNTPTPTPSPSPVAKTVHNVLGAQSQGNPLWEDFMGQARSMAQERGYDPDTIVRQKALESDFGRSRFARERNNFGGIGAYDKDPNQAFKFDDIQAYLKYYFDLVESRYPEAYENRANPEAYVRALKAGNYASDPDYEWKIMNTPFYPR